MPHLRAQGARGWLRERPPGEAGGGGRARGEGEGVSLAATSRPTALIIRPSSPDIVVLIEAYASDGTRSRTRARTSLSFSVNRWSIMPSPEGREEDYAEISKIGLSISSSCSFSLAASRNIALAGGFPGESQSRMSLGVSHVGYYARGSR